MIEVMTTVTKTRSNKFMTYEIVDINDPKWISTEDACKHLGLSRRMLAPMFDSYGVRRAFNDKFWVKMFLREAVMNEEVRKQFVAEDRPVYSETKEIRSKTNFTKLVNQVAKAYKGDDRSEHDVWTEVALRAIASALTDPKDHNNMFREMSPWGKENLKITCRWILDYFKELEKDDQSRRNGR